MQMAVIEYARNVLMHTNANSTEIDENTDYPVIDLMESQKEWSTKAEPCAWENGIVTLAKVVK